MMQPDKFTMKTQAALQDAQAIAHENSHQEIDGEHVLLALLRQDESLIPPLLQKIGVNLSQLEADLNRELGRRVKVQGTSSRDVFWSSNFKKALDAAEKEAGKLKDEYLSTEHLLLGLIAEAGAGLKKLFENHQ